MGAESPGSLRQAGISLSRLGLSCLLTLRVQGVSNNTHQYTAYHPEQWCRPGRTCCRLARGRWGWLWPVVCGCQDRCRSNKPEYCRCAHGIPGVLLCPPAYVCHLLGRYLHIRHSVLYGGFGISGLLCEKYTFIISVVVLFLLWPGQQRCVRMLHVAGAGVRHTVAPSAGATCFAGYACR
jgi:hypothetical protein